VTEQALQTEQLEAALSSGEEYRLFSYGYVKDGQTFRDAYYFDRKKGAYHVTGFLVVDEQGQAVSREQAIDINESFNLYNYLFKRFQSDWGDVVQQDMRKYVKAQEHFKQILEYYRSSAASGEQQDEAQRDVLNMYQEGAQVVDQVLACQQTFLDLDMEAIELGQKKRKQGYIDEEIVEAIRNLIQSFERTIFEQFYVQYASRAKRDELLAYVEQYKPPKEIKRNVKKALKIFKRMDKLVSKHEERLLGRMEDQTNEQHYRSLAQEWKQMLRNQ
jgi:hypothetical protein